MSIAADVRQAKSEFDDHVAKHKCRPAATGERCDTRVEMWQAYVGTAGLLGQEPDDDRRQREHALRNERPAAA